MGNSDLNMASCRIVVVSDTHRDIARLERLLPVINGANRLVFCGDGVMDIMRVRGGITVPIVCVKGNNDLFSSVDIEDVASIMLCGVKTLITHGHRYGVRQGVAQLLFFADANDGKLVLFGHTHCYCDIVRDGVRFINPGALCNGSYAVIEYDGKEITCKQCHI